MSLLSKFIDSLHVHFQRSAYREVVSPVMMNGAVEKHNLLVMLLKGHMRVGKNELIVPERTFCFFPAGEPIYVRHGQGEYRDIGNEGVISDEQRSSFVRTLKNQEDIAASKELFVIISFDVMLYDAIPFFEVIGMPMFTLPQDEELGYLIRHIALENDQNKLGREKIISNYMEEIIIHVCRYMDSQPDFKQYLDKLEFLTDRRLVDIVKYIRENLDKDLSNKTIANIAYISEDYVGQFFKTLTGKNLQDYIESQRLERALFLLKTQPDNIQEIAHRVGFKDPAYFSRRFKMKFGSNANAVRQNKNQMV